MIEESVTVTMTTESDLCDCQWTGQDCADAQHVAELLNWAQRSGQFIDGGSLSTNSLDAIAEAAAKAKVRGGDRGIVVRISHRCPERDAILDLAARQGYFVEVGDWVQGPTYGPGQVIVSDEVTDVPDDEVSLHYAAPPALA